MSTMEIIERVFAVIGAMASGLIVAVVIVEIHHHIVLYQIRRR